MAAINNNTVPATKKTRRGTKSALAIGAILTAVLVGSPRLGLGDTTDTSKPTGTIITAGTDSQDTVILAANQARKIVTSTKIKRANVLAPEVADVIPLSATSILISPKAAGTTELIINDENDVTEVVKLTVESDVDALRKQLKVLFPADTIEVTEVKGSLALRGKVRSVEEAQQIVSFSTFYAPNGKAPFNFLEVAGGEQIMLHVRFAEVSKSAESKLGVNFGASDGKSFFGNNIGPNAFTTSGSAIGPSSSLASLIGSSPASSIPLFGQGVIGSEAFQYFVDCLRTNGLMRMLAEPDLVTTSGEAASFQAGGQIPIPVPQAGAGGAVVVTIQYQPYGLSLNFLPVVMGDGRIRMKVNPQMSELDYGTAIQLNGSAVPGLTTRDVNTTVELNEGQTFAIAGLLQDVDTANVSTIPGLGDIPILGALFRDVDYLRNETELVVLVTPELVHPMNPADVPSPAGESWRNPTESDLFFFKDMGGPAADTNLPPDNKGPAPRFHGAYGFTPPDATPATAGK